MDAPLLPPAQCVHADWLVAATARLQRGESLVLITVARALGSTPRDAGARMWVEESDAYGTIGGGHLELQAIEAARDMLNDANAPAAFVRHYALGPSLGQCCGGAVWLAFERLGPADSAWCKAMLNVLQTGATARRSRHIPAPATNLPAWRLSDAAAPEVYVDAIDASEMTQPDAWWREDEAILVDVTPGDAPVVVVCGAGHVGKAIVRVLAELPVRVIWLDPRDDEWPPDFPVNVRCVVGDASDVASFPDDAYWLVLTHSHALDLDILEAVLRHKSFRYLGLIGSATKAARFRSRLLRKFPPDLVDRVICPIGIVETSSKLPGVIAISVAAQLVGLLEQTKASTKTPA